MNIHQIKTILEISALRQMNNIIGNTSSTNNTSIFSSVLEQLLTNENVASSTNHSVSTLIDSARKTKKLPVSLLSSSKPNIKLANSELQPIIQEAAKKYNLPSTLLLSVIKQESNFNINAVSPSGARGLMQLMPATARSLGVENIDDPQENIMGGAKYLRKMLDQFGSLDLALAAYNAGPGNVNKYNGIPPFKETQNYVAKILQNYNA